MPNQAMAAPSFTTENPLQKKGVGAQASPVFEDIDGDGDLDAFVGYTDGSTVKYYRNTEVDADVPGTGFVADDVGNPLASVSAAFPTPTFADINDDGDKDAFIGAGVAVELTITKTAIRTL